MVVFNNPAVKTGRTEFGQKAFKNLPHLAPVEQAAYPGSNPGGLDARDNPAAGGPEAPQHHDDALSKLDPGDAKPWGELERFEQANSPEFPTEHLPDKFRRFVEAVAEAHQVPVGLAAVHGIGVTGACIAGRVWVQPKPQWVEPTNLYVAVELPPGSRKSTTHKAMLAPLADLEAEELLESQDEIAVALSEQRQLEARKKHLESECGKKPSQKLHDEAIGLAKQLANTPVPVAPRRIVDECTPEELTIILAAQGGRIFSTSDEGGALDHISQYAPGRMPNMQVFLKGWDGSRIIVDRVMRGNNTIEEPLLSCSYVVQPDVLRKLAANPIYRGRGLPQRFLYGSPTVKFGEREIDAPAVPEAVSRDYHDLLRGLAQLEGKTVLELSPDATFDCRCWEKTIEGMLAVGGDLECVREWGSKLLGHTVRLAGILHCLKHGSPRGQIGEDTMKAAVEIADKYFIPHAKHVLRRAAADDNGVGADAEYLWAAIVRHRHEWGNSFSKRDLHQFVKSRGNFKRVADLAPGLIDLVGRNYVRRVPDEHGAKGRPSERYDVNPAAWCGD